MNRLPWLSHLPTLLTTVLLASFHALPWLRWNGRQALLLDLSNRRFDLFGLTLWPGDVGLLISLLAAAAVGLALFTHVAGRLWCGHACPQTLWSTLFNRVERCTRRWLRHPVAERTLRHVLWAMIALWTGVTFVGFFTPIDALLGRLVQLRPSGWEIFWILFYAAATWGNGGFLRRRVCTTLCPFARFQPALSDGHTPRMLYMAPRGEPRGARPAGLGSVARRGRGLLDGTTAQDYVFRAAHPELAGPMPRFAFDRLGDCIDCAACVRACPIGLDIRNGPHADCLSCAACLLACHRVQHDAGFDTGLIRFCAPERMAGRPRRLLRPVTLALLGVLVVLVLLGGWQLARIQREDESAVGTSFACWTMPNCSISNATSLVTCVRSRPSGTSRASTRW